MINEVPAGAPLPCTTPPSRSCFTPSPFQEPRRAMNLCVGRCRPRGPRNALPTTADYWKRGGSARKRKRSCSFKNFSILFQLFFCLHFCRRRQLLHTPPHTHSRVARMARSKRKPAPPLAAAAPAGASSANLVPRLHAVKTRQDAGEEIQRNRSTRKRESRIEAVYEEIGGRVKAADGTWIAWELVRPTPRAGQAKAPLLVTVNGLSNDGFQWAGLMPVLRKDHAVLSWWGSAR